MKKNKTLKRIVSIGMALILVFAMSITSFAHAESSVVKGDKAETTAIQPRTTYNQTVVALPQEFNGDPFNFSGTRLTVAASATGQTGSANSVTVTLRKRNWLGQYQPTGNTATFTPNGDTVTLFQDVKISSGASYCFSYQVSGSSDATARVILTAVTY